MASVSASHLIIFIASVLVAASVAGTITSTVSDLSGAVSEQGSSISNDVRSDIEIISDSGATVYDLDGNGNVTLFVKNTGSNRLSPTPGQMNVLLDGQIRSEFGVEVVSGSDPNSWSPGDVVRVNISAPNLGSGDHRVQLTVNGDEEVFEFNT